MPEELIVKHCSPTLAGIKTGNLFSCPMSSRKEIIEGIRRLNRMLVPKGIRVLPLRYSEKRALIYVFRPDYLAADLADTRAREILGSAGYTCVNVGQCIIKLIDRLKNSEGFPHEIGLFLSYPPEDVSGFMENKACNYKCVGCWKVYGDVEKARQTFYSYEKCKNSYYRQWTCGKSIEQLTVAV